MNIGGCVGRAAISSMTVASQVKNSAVAKRPHNAS